MNILKSKKFQAALVAFLSSLILIVLSNIGFPITEPQAQVLGAKAVALALGYIGGHAIEDHARHSVKPALEHLKHQTEMDRLAGP